MISPLPTPSAPPGNDIKRVPQDAEMRRAIRSLAGELAGPFDRSRPLSREELEHFGGDVLQRLALPRDYLGFTMVAINNAFWQPLLEAVPFHRRLFLLPHCLSDRAACAGTYDSVGLHCAGCGRCEINALKNEAERLGYSVIVAEGTSSVLMKVLEDDADAIFGVACLDSLEKSFQRIVDLGVPHVAVPLLKDGCTNTEAELDQIRAVLAAKAEAGPASPGSAAAVAPPSYIPLLRETAKMFQPPQFGELLQPYLESPDAAVAIQGSELTDQSAADPPSTEAIALQWLREGGKRLRPFVTLAAYAVAKYGFASLSKTNQPSGLPIAIRRLALAIEALHKASLVHDDIEDNDEYRYGRPTLHRVHGIDQTINVGDFLIGLGYRLIAGEMGTLRADCTGDILNRLSLAHLELCRGQGAELQSQHRPHSRYRPADVMKIAAQKTAPAFEAAIYAGMRAAGATVDLALLRRFATYLGEGFQIRNDLDDWREDKQNKRKRGLDARAGRLTMLRVFAAEGEHAAQLDQLTQAMNESPSDSLVEEIYNLYCRSGAVAKVEQLYDKLRDRGLAAAAEFASPDLQELMRFLVRIILPESVGSSAATS